MTRVRGQGCSRTCRRPSAPPARPAGRVAPALLAVLALLACAVLLGLGTWQLQRLQWKLALIERVEQRVHAAPVTAPAPPAWPAVTAAADEYRRVSLAGTFLDDRSVRVQAVTARGSGYWVLTPLRTDAGWTVLVNRGFVGVDATGRAPAIADPGDARVTLSGLLRMAEPDGGFLRKNDPATGRWYSRDVDAIAQAQGLGQVAPYFVDADATPGAGRPGVPVGGMTVVRFHNNHLVYALTWYALALMVAGAAGWIWRQERKQRTERAQ